MRHLDYKRCETLNRWCSVDAHFQDGAGSMSLRLLLLTGANTSVMTICNQSPLRLPSMEDRKLLMLRWLSFPRSGTERISSFFDYSGGWYIHRKQWCTIVNILRLTVLYLNPTMDKISRSPEPEMGPNWSSHTWQHLPVVGYASGYGSPRNNRLGFWSGLEMNPPVFPVRTRTATRFPGPIANPTQPWGYILQWNPLLSSISPQ